MSAFLPPSSPELDPLTRRRPVSAATYAEPAGRASHAADAAAPSRPTGRWWFSFDGWLALPDDEEFVLA
jgi:hypothetical protein